MILIIIQTIKTVKHAFSNRRLSRDCSPYRAPVRAVVKRINKTEMVYTIFRQHFNTCGGSLFVMFEAIYSFIEDNALLTAVSICFVATVLLWFVGNRKDKSAAHKIIERKGFRDTELIPPD